MTTGVGTDEFGRLGRRFTGLNFAILASMVAALGWAVFAFLAGQPNQAVMSQGDRPAAQERQPMPVMVSKSRVRRQAIPAAPAREPAAEAPAEAAQPCPTRGWYVQLGALRGPAHVRELATQGREHGFPVCTSGAPGLTLVLAGPYRDGREAVRARDRLKQTSGIRGFLRKDGGRD